MPILAQFTEGITEITVSGLYQWDYGQTIEIQCSSLTSSFEVHFANRKCAMAHIRMGTTANTIIPIPDALLEQPCDIIAWVYCIGENEGCTIRVIHIPVTPRTKPESDPSIDTTEQTQFQQMMAQFNQTIEYWKDGVKEQNSNTKVRFWYGTQAQYNALTTHADNTLYIISDDPTIANLTASVNGILDGTAATPYMRRKDSEWKTAISNSTMFLTDSNGEIFEWVLPDGHYVQMYVDGTENIDQVYNSYVMDEYREATETYYTALCFQIISFSKTSNKFYLRTRKYDISSTSLQYEDTTDTTSTMKYRRIK